MLYFTKIDNTFRVTSKPIIEPLYSSDFIVLKTPIVGSYYNDTYITLHSNKANSTISDIDVPKYIYDEHILKSNLQKTFRRQLLDPCLSTAMQLLQQSPIDFLRRLAVILLEDSQLHIELYTGVVWYMHAVSKNYNLQKEDIQFIMDAITTGLLCDTYYDLTSGAEFADAKCSQIKCAASGAAWYAIRLRAMAGGMHFDTAFLNRLADRLAVADLPQIDDWSSVQLEDIEEFSVAEHVIKESIDFHCCKELLDICMKVVEDAGVSTTKVKIQDAIWWHRSSINTRTFSGSSIRQINEEKTADLWMLIKKSVEHFSRRRITQLEERRQAVKAVQTLDKWFHKK